MRAGSYRRKPYARRRHIQVGLSRDPGARRAAWNAEAYTGISDWWIARYKPASRMRAVQQILHECFAPQAPTESGREVEVFNVPFAKAEAYLDKFGEQFRPHRPGAPPTF